MIHKQRGFISWVTLVVVAAVLAGVGAIGWNIVSSYNTAIERAEELQGLNKKLAEDKVLLEADKVKLKESNDINVIAINILQAEKQKLEELNIQRAVRTTKVATQEKKVDEKLTLARTDNISWADTPIPATILASLRSTESDSTPDASVNGDKGREGEGAKGIPSTSASDWLSREANELGAIDASEAVATTSSYV